MSGHRRRILVRSQSQEVQIRSGSEFDVEEYHIVDLDGDIIHPHISHPMLIAEEIAKSRMVSLGDSVYILGGCETLDKLTEIASYKSLNPRDKFYSASAHLQIIDHEDGKVSGVWHENPGLSLIGPGLPSVTCLGRKIYNFGFQKFRPLVFDPTTNCWKAIPFPKQYRGCIVSISLLPDTSANRIIFSLKKIVEEDDDDTRSSPSLHAFYPDPLRWEPIVEDFNLWSEAMTIADDVIYITYHFCPTLISAYDLKTLQQLDVHCPDTAFDDWHISAIRRLRFEHVFYLGDNIICLATTLHVYPKSKESECNNESACDVAFFMFRIKRRDSTINLVPHSARFFNLPRTTDGRRMLLLS